MSPAYKSLLHQMTQTTPTCLWNDSAAIDELTASISDGAVGATCNPVIAVTVLKKDMGYWKPKILETIEAMPTATEDQVGWRVVEAMSVRAAALLKPAFDAHEGRNGRLSIQTDPHFYRDPKAIVEQAVRFSELAPNMIVKIPVTQAGVKAIEEATYRGVSINATVSFTLPQSVAVAEAVERGLKRREREGKDISTMGPVCTIMVGRLDDWLRVSADKDGITVDPGVLEWAGVAVFKKTYRLFKQRGYRIRLLSAAFRNHMHWSQFIGGDVVISPPSSRMDEPVDPRILGELEKFPDYRRASTENGLSPAEFDTFGATQRTLRQFLAASAELSALMRDLMIPNPDK